MSFFWLWGLEFLKEMGLIFKHKSQDFVLLDNSCKAAEVLEGESEKGMGEEWTIRWQLTLFITQVSVHAPYFSFFNLQYYSFFLPSSDGFWKATWKEQLIFPPSNLSSTLVCTHFLCLPSVAMNDLTLYIWSQTLPLWSASLYIFRNLLFAPSVVVSLFSTSLTSVFHGVILLAPALSKVDVRVCLLLHICSLEELTVLSFICSRTCAFTHHSMEVTCQGHICVLHCPNPTDNAPFSPYTTSQHHWTINHSFPLKRFSSLGLQTILILWLDSQHIS